MTHRIVRGSGCTITKMLSEIDFGATTSFVIGERLWSKNRNSCLSACQSLLRAWRQLFTNIVGAALMLQMVFIQESLTYARIVLYKILAELFFRIIFLYLIQRNWFRFVRTCLLSQASFGLALRHSCQEIMHSFSRGLSRSHRWILCRCTFVYCLLSRRIWICGRISIKWVLNSKLNCSMRFQDLFFEVA